MKKVSYDHSLVGVGVILVTNVAMYRVVQFLKTGNRYEGDTYRLIAETGRHKGQEYIYAFPRNHKPDTVFFLLLPDETIPSLEEML